MNVVNDYSGCSPSSLAVLTVNAAKSYKVNAGRYRNVFERVNLNVAQKSIYALLGPSGCGKTTLLRCITGRLELDDGQVFAFGQHPGTVGSGIPGGNLGYMIQESSIHDTLTIFESWRYYGGLVGVSRKDVDAVSDHFIKLLALPPGDTVNGQLSGGQLRRVAFVAAVIHRPKLLILDEPTVGIDPISKQRIWQHLEHLLNENSTTILLTTHYIEEARSAHRIGLMHGGTLAAEDETEHLLSQYQCTTLEDVFLKICSMGVDNHCSEVMAPGHQDDQKSMTNSWISNFSVRLHVLKTLMLKNFIHLCRFPGAVVSLFLIPLIQLLMVHLAFGATFSPLPIHVVNNDHGSLGNVYLDLLDSDILNVVLVDSQMTANDSIQNGATRAFLTIPKNFSDHTLQIISDFPLTTAEAALGSTIKVFLDDTVPILSHLVSVGVLDALQQFRLLLLSNRSDWNPYVANPVIEVTKSTLTKVLWPDPSVIPCGALILIIYFAPVASAVLAMSVEHYKGYLEHCFVRGVTIAELLLGLFIVLLAILLLQTALDLLLGCFLFGFNTSASSVVLMYTLLYFQGAAGIAFGLFLSMAVRHMHVLNYVSGICFIFSCACSGIFWPIESVPYLAQLIFRLLPFFYPFRALVLILHNESKAISAGIAKTFACSLSWMAIFLILTMLLLKSKN